MLKAPLGVKCVALGHCVCVMCLALTVGSLLFSRVCAAMFAIWYRVIVRVICFQVRSINLSAKVARLVPLCALSGAVFALKMNSINCALR